MNFICPRCRSVLLETFDRCEGKDKKIKVNLFYACAVCDKQYSFKLMLFEEGKERKEIIGELSQQELH